MLFVLQQCVTTLCYSRVLAINCGVSINPVVYLSTLSPTENNVGSDVTPLRVKQNYSSLLSFLLIMNIVNDSQTKT